MYRFQKTIVTKASADLAWNIFADLRKWKTFTTHYGVIRWIEGHAWQIGSRIEMEILHPMKIIVSRLIICCEPAKEVGWIDRALGITVGQWVTFDNQIDGRTRIDTWGDMTRETTAISGTPASELLSQFTEKWYEGFRDACDEALRSDIAR